MSPEQRLDLIRRLSLASWTVKTSQHRSVGRREVEIIILVISAVVLIPWIAYLAVTLPHVYVTHNWDQAWVGFDILLLPAYCGDRRAWHFPSPHGHVDRVRHRGAADLRCLV